MPTIVDLNTMLDELELESTILVENTLDDLAKWRAEQAELANARKMAQETYNRAQDMLAILDKNSSIQAVYGVKGKYDALVTRMQAACAQAEAELAAAHKAYDTATCTKQLARLDAFTAATKAEEVEANRKAIQALKGNGVYYFVLGYNKGKVIKAVTDSLPKGRKASKEDVAARFREDVVAWATSKGVDAECEPGPQFVADIVAMIEAADRTPKGASSGVKTSSSGNGHNNQAKKAPQKHLCADLPDEEKIKRQILNGTYSK